MSISAFRPLNPHDQAVEDAMMLIERSGIDRTLTDLMLKDTGRPRLYFYTVRAVLTGMFLAVAAGTPTVKCMTESLWHLATNERWLSWSGMDRITAMQAAKLAQGENHKLFLKEVDRFRRDYEAMHAPIDGSPFPRGKRVQQSERITLLEKLKADPEVVIKLHDRDERLFEVTNALIAASAPAAEWRATDHSGSIAVDETRARSHCSKHPKDGMKPERFQAADPDVALREDKKYSNLYHWYHLVQIASPAGNPYGRRPPEIVAGVYFLHNYGEDDGHGAIGAVRAAISNGWGPAGPKARALCIADRGISQKNYFAQHILQLGYRPCFDQEEPEPDEPIIAIDPEDRASWRKSILNPVGPGDGPELIRGVWVSPTGKHLGMYRNAVAPEEKLLTDEMDEEYIDELVEVDDVTREFMPHVMKENRRPVVDDSNPDPAKWTVSFELTRPEFGADQRRFLRHDWSARSSVRDQLAAEDLPKCLRQKTITIVQPISVVKHIDAFPRFTFEHEDYYNWNRTHNEQRNFDWARSMLGGLEPRDIEVLGRARVGFLITISIARANLVALRRAKRLHGDKDNLPLNIRNYYKARRTQLIAQRRRERIMPGRGTPNRSDKSKKARGTSRPASSRTD